MAHRDLEDLAWVAWEQRTQAAAHTTAERLTRYLPQSAGVWVDVGANVGAVTHALLRGREETTAAHLFEPCPQGAQRCRQRFAHLPKVVVHEQALSDRTTAGRLWCNSGPNKGWNTMVEAKLDPGMVEIGVQEVSVEDFLTSEKIAAIDLMKIDVEGYEWKILGGLLKALRKGALKHRPVIFVEIGWGNGHPDWERYSPLFQGFEALGYRVRGEIGWSTVDRIWLPV